MLYLFFCYIYMLGYVEGFFLILWSFKILFFVFDFFIFLIENENIGSVGCLESSFNLVYFK